MEKPLLAAGVVLLGLIGVAAAAACAWEPGGAAVDVGEGADAPAPAGRCRLLPAVAVGGAHRRRVRGRVWLAVASCTLLASRGLLLLGLVWDIRSCGCGGITL